MTTFCGEYPDLNRDDLFPDSHRDSKRLLANYSRVDCISHSIYLRLFLFLISSSRLWASSRLANSSLYFKIQSVAFDVKLEIPSLCCNSLMDTSSV